jgi:hypothetical protein
MSSEPGTVDGESPASLGSHRLSVQISPGDVGIGNTAVGSVVWDDLVVEWENYVREKMDERLVFVDTVEDDFLVSPYSHRFTDEYSKMTYARIKDFERGMFEEYDDPSLVFLTFTTSTTTASGNPRCPFSVMDEIVDSWSSGVRYELDKSMKAERKKDTYPGFESGEFEYLRILEPTTENGYGPSGYPHQHLVLAVDGDVERERFESVIEKHLDKAPNALGRAHEFDTAIEIMDGEELTNVGAYIFKYLGKTYESGELEEYERRFNALLWESGRRRIQPSDGAQKWMDRDTESSVEPGRFQFAGVGESEKATELLEYDSVSEFRLEKEMGVRAYLSGRESVGVDVERDVSGEKVSDTVFIPPDVCGPQEHTIRGTGPYCVRCGSSVDRLEALGHLSDDALGLDG